MDLRIDTEKKIAYIKIFGFTTSKQILEALDMTASNEKYQKGMGRLWDFRDADLSSLNFQTIRKLGKYSKKFPPGINDVKVAFVSERDLEYGLSRMFEMSSEANTLISVFRTIDDAEKWLME